MEDREPTRSVMVGWPAAKYLPYAFWRAWFLVMYSSPFWLMFALPECANPGFQMHIVSTFCFVVASILLAVFHVKTVGLLAVPALILGSGVAASIGVALEFAALALWQTLASPLFVTGAALTGLGTAPIALRAGQIYASVRVNAAITGTLLSDVAAGLIFFFAVGTWPIIGLALAVFLPLLSALTLVVCSPAGDDALADQQSTAPVHAPLRPFFYFLVAVFLIGAVAFLQNSLGGSWFTQASIDAGSTLGVSLLIMVSFLLAVGFAYMQKVRLEALYRPTILLLSACVLVAYLVRFGSPAAIGGTLLVYCLFSSYIWMLMAYLGHGRYFSPIQVVGYGRAVYAGGSLVGGLAGMYLLPAITDADTIPTIAVGMVAVLLLCAVAIRPKDLLAILAPEGMVGEGAAARAMANASSDGLAAAASVEPGPQSEAEPSPEAPDGEGEGAPADEFASPLAAGGSAEAVHLSPREREVFALMCEGRDAAYIANSLCVSRNTAKTHIRNIYGKFGVHTRQEFVEVMHGETSGR